MSRHPDHAGPRRRPPRIERLPTLGLIAAAVAAAGLAIIGSDSLGGSGPASAQGEWRLEIVGQVGGGPRAVVVREGLAYLGVGPRLVLVGMSDPTTPEVMGQSEILPGLVESIALDGDYAYAATDLDGLRILDVSDPSRPLPVAHLGTGGRAVDVSVDDGFGFVATFAGGVRVVDVRDPLAPRIIADIATSGVARAVHLDGYALYIGHSDGLSIVDVRLPFAPRLESELPLGDVLSVHMDGDHAIAVTTDGTLGGLHVVDVSDPSSAAVVATHALPDQPLDVWVADGIAYVALSDDGLLTVDVSDPRHPADKGLLEVENGAARVHVSEEHAFVALQKGGVVVADIGDPTAPVPIGAYVTLGEIETVHARPGTGIVYGLGPRVDQMWGIDVRSPEADLPLRSWKVGSDRSAYALFTLEDRLFVGGRTTEILDVGVPEGEVPLGRWQAPGGGMATVHATSDIAIVTLLSGVDPFESVLFVLDVRDPRSPVELGRLPLTGLAWRVVVAAGHAYVAAGDGGLRIVDLSDPTQPREVGAIETMNVFDVAARDEIVLALAHEIGLVVFDVSAPDGPSEIGRVELGRQSRLDVDGRFAYTSGDYDYLQEGLTAIDLQDPTAPKVVARRAVPGYAYGVRAADGRVYLASYDGGLSVLQLDPIAAATATPTASAGPPPTTPGTPGSTPSPTPGTPARAVYLPAAGR